MGAKSNYLDHRSRIREQMRINNDTEAIAKMEKGIERYKKWSKNWTIADLDEVVNRLIPNATIDSESSNQKIIFSNPNSPYKVLCDKSGSYFRITKTVVDKYGSHEIYVGLDGAEPKKVINGKNVALSKEDFKRLTHFKMLIRKEKK